MRVAIFVLSVCIILSAQYGGLFNYMVIGSPVNEGGSGGWGSSAHFVAASDGTRQNPVTDPRPTVSVQRFDASQHWGPLIPYQIDSTKLSGPGHFYPFRSFLRQESPDLEAAVALSGSVHMDPSSKPRVVQTGWGGWLHAGRVHSGSRICGLEIDVSNYTDTDAPPDSYYGYPHENTSSLGLQIVSLSKSANSIGAEFVGAPGPFMTALKFSPGSARNYGIDMGQLNTTRTPIRLPQNGYLSSASGYGIDIPLVGFDGAALHMPTRVRMTGIPFCGALPVGTLCRSADGVLRVTQ